MIKIQHPDDVACAREIWKLTWPSSLFDPSSKYAQALIDVARRAREREAAKHPQEEDPDLIKAREYTALDDEAVGFDDLALSTREGFCDNRAEIRLALSVIRGEREASKRVPREDLWEDPNLIKARQYAADHQDFAGWAEKAQLTRSGANDGSEAVQSAFLAIKGERGAGR